MTRLIVAAIIATLAAFSQSIAETEVIIRDDDMITIRREAPKPLQAETPKVTEADVNALTRDEARYIWDSLSTSERIDYKRNGIRSFDELSMEDKKRLVQGWDKKKNTRVHIISPGQAERMNQQ